MYFGRLIIAGLLIGLFVMNNGRKLEDNDDEIFYSGNDLVTYQAYNTTSVMFILASISIVGTAFAIIILHTNIRIMKYEIDSGLHHTVSCWLSLVLVDLPVYLLASVILATIVWALLGNYKNHYHTYIGIMVLITIAGYSLALAVVVYSKTSSAAMLYYSFYGSFSILFTGFLQTIPDLPGLWSWITTAAFSRWAFEALLLQEYQNSPNYHEYLDQFGFDGQDSSVQFCIEWLIVWCIALQAVIVIGLFPPIYDTNFFKERYGNRSQNNRRLIQEALEMDEDDVVMVEELDSNTDRNRHAGSILITSPLVRGNMSVERVNPAAELNLLKEIRPINLKSQVVLTFENLNYTDHMLLDMPLLWGDEDSIGDSPRSSISSASNAMPTSAPTAFSYQHHKLEPLLQNISASVKPGQSCCILDSSDRAVGKILLQILSSSTKNINHHQRIGISLPGKLTGKVSLLDQQVKKASFVNSVYIPFGDYIDYYHNPNYTELPSSLTVKEVLVYSALLRRTDQTSFSMLRSAAEKVYSQISGRSSSSSRRPSSFSQTQSVIDAPDDDKGLDRIDMIGKSKDLMDRVNEIITIMGLTLVSNTIIGSTSSRAKGILASQLRCLSIAVELVNRPNLIFLEDPFYGLDWFDCQAVSVSIQNLSKNGRTIIASLERPRSSAVFGFDQMLLLGSGLLLYNGLSVRAASYFENIGYEKRWDQSPLEFILDVALDKGKLKQVKASSQKSSASSTGHGLSYHGSVHVFSLEDLAELCSNNRGSFSSSRRAHQHPASNPSSMHIDHASLPYPEKSEDDPSSLKAFQAAIGPTARVLLNRGFYVTFSNVSVFFLCVSRLTNISCLYAPCRKRGLHCIGLSSLSPG
jgi:ABC-type multidrug transport system ATPase subunit